MGELTTALELGVRLACGASARALVALVMRQTGGLALGGLLAGAALAFGLSQFLSGLLFHVEASRPTTLLAAAIGLSVAATIAAFVPPSLRDRPGDDPEEPIR